MRISANLKGDGGDSMATRRSKERCINFTTPVAAEHPATTVPTPTAAARACSNIRHPSAANDAVAAANISTIDTIITNTMLHFEAKAAHNTSSFDFSPIFDKYKRLKFYCFVC